MASKLGTCRIKDHAALTDFATESLLLKTLADLKRDPALTLQKSLWRGVSEKRPWRKGVGGGGGWRLGSVRPSLQD